jgi:hypothetical protein
MDEYLDQYMEDHINGSYGDILDELAADEFAEFELDEPWDDTGIERDKQTSRRAQNGHVHKQQRCKI